MQLRTTHPDAEATPLGKNIHPNGPIARPVREPSNQKPLYRQYVSVILVYMFVHISFSQWNRRPSSAMWRNSFMHVFHNERAQPTDHLQCQNVIIISHLYYIIYIYHIILYHIILYYIILYCIILYSILFYYIMLYHIILYHIISYHNISYYVTI